MQLIAMTKKNNQPPINETQAAINLALQAERETANAITQSEKEAQEIIANGRKKARRIAERTDRRITALHQRCHIAVNNAITKFRKENQANECTDTEASIGNEQIVKAAKRLAEQLTTQNTVTTDDD